MASTGTVLSGENPLLISPLSLFLIQTVVVICTARLLAVCLKWINQPQVMAEILGGIVLGATALSRIPAFKENLFPQHSLPLLKLVADLGLVLYLFLVGLELDPLQLLKIFKKSVSISVAGIALPFALGAGVAKFIYDNYADQNVSFVSFLLFTGVAMSITAFPVLARILTERKMLHTRVGQATISAAAVDDFIAWTLLVLVIALINNSGGSGGGASSYATAIYVFLCVVAWALFLWFAIRPLILRMVKLAEDRETLQRFLLFVVFTLVLFSGWFTEIIGVQAIFGGFLVGVIIPHEHGFARKLAHQIEDLVTIVFLPLFFAYSGLNTDLTLLRDGQSWGFVALICFVACAGKMVGCTLTSRISGLNWRESGTVGILMNTRGLVQIIVLNVGLNAGVITPKIFSMFVIMAVFTTFLTVPLVTVFYPPSFYAGEFNAAANEDVEAIDNKSVGGGIESNLVEEPLDESHIRALVCLPALNVVSPMMTLCTMISGSPELSAFTVFALRLVKLDSRFSTVMQAAEHTNTIKEDPILSVFRTFASLHGLNSFPMLQFSDSSHVSDAIVDAAKQANATIVFVPQSASKTSGTPTTPIAGTSTQGKYQSSWIGDDSTQQMRRVVTEVCGSLKCVSVVHFIDRGFMSLNARGGDTAGQGSALQSVFRPAGVAESSPLVGKELARPKPPRLNSAFFQSKIKVVLIVGGLKDASESEAVRLVQHVTGSQSVSTSVIFETYIVRLVRDAKANSANTTVEEEVQDVSLPNATTIQMETVDVVALTTQLAGLVKHHEDLVVIGETALKLDARVHFSDDSKQSSTSSAGLEQWLEYDCAASIAIVHGR